VAYDFSAVINNTGNAQNDVFPGNRCGLNHSLWGMAYASPGLQIRFLSQLMRFLRLHNSNLSAMWGRR